MKLTPDTIKYIHKAVKTAQLLDIDDICIEKNIIRSMHEDRTVLIIHHHDKDLPFNCIGISRIPQLVSRLNIVLDADDSSITCTNTDDDFVKAIKMKCSTTTIDFKCANPAKITAPRKIADPMQQRIHVTPESVDMLKRSEVAMKADVVAVINDGDNNVSFELTDINNDTLKHNLTTKSENLTEFNNPFKFKYPTKLFISLLKHNAEYFDVAGLGSVKININGFDVYMLPKI